MEKTTDTKDDFDLQLEKLSNLQTSMLDALEHYKDDQKILTLDEITKISGAVARLSGSASSILFKKREMEYKERIDFHHPKIQRSFGFLIETVIEAMEEQNVSQEDIRGTIDRLSFKLIGFEDKLNITLKNLNMTMVDHSINPLVQKALNPN